ncbi:MAG: 4Fe-4S dicluster domain-containing protein [Acidobacteria bacterium]|nr:4Fe-4S dicluster domain-containing protein [Acidobacteriota bacterium]
MMNPELATREVFWNIPHSLVWVMYLMFVASMAVAAYGIYRRVQIWRRGLSAKRFDRPLERLKLLLKHSAAQQRTVREKYAAIFHTFIYTGFIVLALATTVVAIEYDLGLPVMQGRFYLYFQSFIVDVFGVLVLIGVGIALYRRAIVKPRKLVYTDEATLILTAIFLMALTGFLVEGWRIGATDEVWGKWSPFGYLLAQASAAMLSRNAMRAAHFGAWWTHAVLVFGFIAWSPFTKMAHVVFAPLNIYTASLRPTGAALKNLDIEKAMESGAPLGVKSLAQFTWKDLADFDACTECGRCTGVCPAHTVGKELSPRDIILDLQKFMHANPRAAFGLPNGNSSNGNSANGGDQAASRKPQAASEALPIIGALAATSPAALWQCTTCGACMEACPVFIEQMPKIVDMRRFLVMEEADFPDTMADAVTSMETRGHPFKGTQSTRVDWTEGLQVQTMAEAKDAEVLFWVGCGGALIERNQKTVRATAQLLHKAGVKFAILGREEKCTGDPARRIGNEFLFEMLAKENTEKLNHYGVKKIITSCPHCFNTFRNEYPQYGGEYEVFHHSEYLAKLVDEGRLAPLEKNDKKITFHDPCYLGRHNGVFDAPRQLVQIAARNAPIEMAQSRENGFCCGGGGGMSFIDEPKDQRVNQERARQILATGADIVAVGCPFCTTMLEDGINARKGDRDVRVMDVAELLWQAVQDSTTNGANKN